ncbi:MAG: cysteine desulfurase [Methanomassiliicoccales archaeon]
MDAYKIRRDFPVFSGGSDDPVYLDNACQTLRPRQVINASNEYYYRFPACSGRSVHHFATEVSIRVEESRERIAKFIGCPHPNEIIFTKNCTEALNLVAKGLKLKNEDIVLISDIEHNSNYIPWLQLEQQRGIKRKIIPTTREGIFDIEVFKNLMSRKVKVVSFAHANNVTGTSIPAKEIAEIAHDYGAVVVFDGAQAAPHMPLNITELDADFYAFSMHKMLGPAGVGVLFGKEELLENLDPLVVGGGSIDRVTASEVYYLSLPEKLESGLLNYSGIIGSGAAIEYLERIGMDEICSHVQMLNRHVTEILKNNDRIDIIGPADYKLRGNIFSFNVKGLTPHDVAMILDQMKGVMVRSGMHCSHIFFINRQIDGCVRASFYVYNTVEDCEILIKTLQQAIHLFSI